jgi:hypothetical protein
MLLVRFVYEFLLHCHHHHHFNNKPNQKKKPITTATKIDLRIWFVCCFFDVLFFDVLFFVLFCFSLCDGDRESTGRQGVKMMMTKKKKDERKH